jgi:hypothetical protein
LEPVAQLDIKNMLKSIKMSISFLIILVLLQIPWILRVQNETLHPGRTGDLISRTQG